MIWTPQESRLSPGTTDNQTSHPPSKNQPSCTTWECVRSTNSRKAPSISWHRAHSIPGGAFSANLTFPPQVFVPRQLALQRECRQIPWHKEHLISFFTCLGKRSPLAAKLTALACLLSRLCSPFPIDQDYDNVSSKQTGKETSAKCLDKADKL